MRLIDNCAKCDATKDLYIVPYIEGSFYLCPACWKEYKAEFRAFRKKFLRGDILVEEKEEKA